MLKATLIDTVKTEGFNDIDNLIPFLLLADPSLLLVDLQDGLAGGDVDVHCSSHVFDVLSVVENAVDDGLADLLCDLLVAVAPIFL